MLKEYSLSSLFGISDDVIYYANRIELTKEPVMEWPHRKSFYSIMWFLEGEGFRVIDFHEYKILPGRMFLINPEQINNWSFSPNCKGYVLLFDKSMASQLCIQFTQPCITIKKHNTILLRLVFENLIKDYRKDSEDSQNKIMASIQYLYSLILEKTHAETFHTEKTSTVFLQFKDLILNSDHKIQSMDKYANTLHISTEVLNNICKNFAGISAKQLLLDLKMTEAKRLLLYSKLSVSEIAFQLGFDDSSYFTRIFRKKNALIPTLFRKKYRQK